MVEAQSSSSGNIPCGAPVRVTSRNIRHWICIRVASVLYGIAASRYCEATRRHGVKGIGMPYHQGGANAYRWDWQDWPDWHSGSMIAC